MTRKIFALLCSTAFLLLTARPAISAAGERKQTPAAAADDGTMKALVAIAGAGDMEAHAYQDLEELSDDIGARVTGSPDAARAIAWGVVKNESHRPGERPYRTLENFARLDAHFRRRRTRLAHSPQTDG